MGIFDALCEAGVRFENIEPLWCRNLKLLDLTELEIAWLTTWYDKNCEIPGVPAVQYDYEEKFDFYRRNIQPEHYQEGDWKTSEKCYFVGRPTKGLEGHFSKFKVLAKLLGEGTYWLSTRNYYETDSANSTSLCRTVWFQG